MSFRADEHVLRLCPELRSRAHSSKAPAVTGSRFKSWTSGSNGEDPGHPIAESLLNRDCNTRLTARVPDHEHNRRIPRRHVLGDLNVHLKHA